jgi:hypothetical protein
MSHLREAVAQGVASRMFAQHKVRLINADVLGAHDFIRGLMLQHAVLMNARLVREGVRADDGFVRLDDDTRVIADQF